MVEDDYLLRTTPRSSLGYQRDPIRHLYCTRTRWQTTVEGRCDIDKRLVGGTRPEIVRLRHILEAFAPRSRSVARARARSQILQCIDHASAMPLLVGHRDVPPVTRTFLPVSISASVLHHRARSPPHRSRRHTVGLSVAKMLTSDQYFSSFSSRRPFARIAPSPTPSLSPSFSDREERNRASTLAGAIVVAITSRVRPLACCSCRVCSTLRTRARCSTVAGVQLGSLNAIRSIDSTSPSWIAVAALLTVIASCPTPSAATAVPLDRWPDPGSQLDRLASVTVATHPPLCRATTTTANDAYIRP